ncbi:WD40 repeat-like protein [Westerdykella ornata]|uniref:WD40 repeat-like protein n=1 Tax=Westerdykella ornata TaxID=318751 RepID=A0A6A6JCI3_WESOR|nr:WD40 repeat-like protein [Westerdykella ornata]KAF2274271.1 WD40 repeat-like protein [Westerdykella ornata]
MAQSSDPGHFFQTDNALHESARKAAKRAKSNTKGDPITLPSKILAIAADPWGYGEDGEDGEDGDEGSVFVAEAAGTVKRVALDSKTITTTFTGPAAPLTSLAVSTRSRQIFAGCWDKSIWCWDVPSPPPPPPPPSSSSNTSASTSNSTSRSPTQPAKRRLQGHADFVKCLLLVNSSPGEKGKELLVSGCADGTISVWDVESGRKLYSLTGHTRAVLSLALDPASSTPEEEEGNGTDIDNNGSKGAVVVFSAGTDRTIRQWCITPTTGHPIAIQPSTTTNGANNDANNNNNEGIILAHETSIDAITFDTDADLWTASADKTAKCLSRAHNWSPELSLPHPDFVRDVVVDEEGGFVVTACRDEEVRVWDRGTGELRVVFAGGHWEEVTGLLLLERRRLVLSVSIDGTIRRWSLKARDLARAVEEARAVEDGREKDRDEEMGTETGKASLLTEEEERELAELLEESE